jgi:GTP-binding protein
VRAIEAELGRYSEELKAKPRWLVINKIDLLAADKLEAAKNEILENLGWEQPVFLISAATGEGIESLGQAVMRALEEMNEAQPAAW